MEIKAEYRKMFAEEAQEHLEEWEAALLKLERSPQDKELIHGIFRAVHTLKGSAGFIGFEKLQRLAHELESVLEGLREGSSQLTAEGNETLFQGLDLARRMVEAFTAGEDFDEDIDGFLEGLRAQLATGQTSPAAPRCPAEPPKTAVGGATAAISAEGARRFRLELLIHGTGREAFLRSFLVRQRLSGCGSILSEEPPPEVLRDSGGRFSYVIGLETDRDAQALRQALNVDLLEIVDLQELAAAPPAASPKPEGKNGEAAESAAASAEAQTRAGRADEVVRVSVERLDSLLNLVGELVIQNSGFISISQQLKDRYGKSPQVLDLEVKTEALAKTTRDLQDGIMKVRMLPLHNVFSRFYRVVRDLAKDRNKGIELEVFGEQTEIDKKVMDRIGDPLVHLVRNAVDHGIESREERLAAGKTPVGRIRLGAYQDGDHICIEVSDDGRGLDRAAVLRKGVQMGLVRPEAAAGASDEQVLGLIFLPGFSTAKQVSEVSGRGVGMDVVKRAIEGLGGSVRLRSVAGRGATVTIALPLTMAIIPAVLVQVGDSTLAVPLSAVKEVLKVGKAELQSVGRRAVIRLREQVLAVVQLREALGLSSDTPGGRGEEDRRPPVVIVEYEDKRIGLGVDRVLGTSEIVIKSLSRHYREIEGLIGASILGSGRIALIVDVEALVRLYHNGRGEARSGGNGRIFEGQDCAPAAAPELPPTPAAPEGEAVPAGRQADELAEELSRAAGGALLEEIHNTGAIQASMALSQLTGREVRVSFPETKIMALAEVADFLGGEELPVGGIYVGLEGELAGGTLVVLPEANLMRFHDLLYRRPRGTCGALEEVDMSAIAELGNILAASFINAMSDSARLGLRSNTPEISTDMCLPVIDSVLARFNQPGERILISNALLFFDDDDQVICHLLLFLEPQSLRRLLQVLAANLEQASSGLAENGK